MKTRTIPFHRQFHDILCLLAGGLLPLAFAPFHFFWLAVLCPALLLHCWLHTHKIPRAIWRGFLFGFGFFAVGVSWVYVSIHEFGGVNIFFAGLIALLFAILLSTVFMAQGAILNWLFPKPNQTKLLLAFPASWALFEWMREWLFTGFPWLYLGYSQSASPLGGYASIIGTYGTSFITALIAGLLVNAFSHKAKIRLWSIVTAILIALLGATLYPVHWTKPFGKAVTVSLVQGNIPQSMKWDPNQVIPTLNKYRLLTEKHWADLVIWPEAAVPLTLDEAKPFLKQMAAKAKQHHSTLITGIPTESADKQSFFNAAIALGDGSGLYAKRHLVPFGEYIPLHFLFGNFLKMLNIPFPDMIPGKKQQAALSSQPLKIAPFICYEIAYPGLLLKDLPQANLLTNLSNDAWFGHSFAASQQLQIAQMRALQSGRYMLTSTNNGITAIISPHGEILKQLKRFQSGVLTGEVHAMQGSTIWASLGNWPIIIVLLLLLGWAWLQQRKD